MTCAAAPRAVVPGVQRSSRFSGNRVPQLGGASQPVEFAQLAHQRLDLCPAAVHEPTLEAPAEISGTAVRRPVAIGLFRLETRIEVDPVEKPRMHLRRI